MNRQQFLEQLEAELSGLAPVERQEALKFYVEYLDCLLYTSRCV